MAGRELSIGERSDTELMERLGELENRGDLLSQAEREEIEYELADREEWSRKSWGN